MSLRSLKLWAVVVVGLGLTASSAKASFTIDLGTEFSGSGSGNLAAGSLLLEDLVGSVRVTLTGGAGLPNSGKITGLYLNFSSSSFTVPATSPFSSISATGYVVGSTSYNGSPANANTQFNLGVNAYQADGDGHFDIKIDFNNSGNGAATFGDGDTFTFIISGTSATALEAGMLSRSLGSGNSPNGLYAAVHAQGLGSRGEQSGWYTGTPDDNQQQQVTPAPAGLVLIASAAPFALLLRRLRRQPTAA